MSKTIAATAGLAVLLATAAPAQAQSAAAPKMSSAAKRLVLKAKNAGGTRVKARCRAPKRGISVCSVSYRAGDGRRCADPRVTVVRRNGRMNVKGFAPLCKAAQAPVAPQQPPVDPAQPSAPVVVEPPATIPGSPAGAESGGPLFDPGAGVPGGAPPGAGSALGTPPGAPTTSAKRSALARTASAENNSFLGCTQWQKDWWYGSWWMYVCYWAYSSAPAGAHLIGWQTTYVAQVYYWNGYQAAFWFRSEWTA